jgi:hypothetical protein
MKPICLGSFNETNSTRKKSKLILSCGMHSNAQPYLSIFKYQTSIRLQIRHSYISKRLYEHFLSSFSILLFGNEIQ